MFNKKLKTEIQTLEQHKSRMRLRSQLEPLVICVFNNTDTLMLFIISVQIIFLSWHYFALRNKYLDFQIGCGITSIVLWSLTFLSPFPDLLNKSFYSVIINFCFGCGIFLFCCTVIFYFHSKFKR